jgi:hypothetical protein
MRLVTVKRLWALQWTLLAGAIGSIAMADRFPRWTWTPAYLGLIFAAMATNRYRKRLQARLDQQAALGEFFPELDAEISRELKALEKQHAPTAHRN